MVLDYMQILRTLLLTAVLTLSFAGEGSLVRAGEIASEKKAASGSTERRGCKERVARLFHRKKKTGSRRRARGNAPCLAWLPQDSPIESVILCVHGLGLHNGTYEPFGKEMIKRQYAIYAIDVRGFGSWARAEGRKKVDFDSCLEDVRKTLKVIKRAHKDLPVFLLGESMGGAIALRVTALYPELVDGLVSSVPAADRFKQTKTKLKVMFHFLKRPTKPINVGEGVVRQATKKQELQEAWLSDPLSRFKLTARELYQFDKFMSGNHEFARKIVDKPVLMVQGSRDKLVKPEGTMEVYNNLGTKDKKFVLVSGAEHLIFEENQFSKQELDILDNWIRSHTKKASKARDLKENSEDLANSKTNK